MEILEIVLPILFAHLLAVASPGPDFVIVLKNSLSYSRKTGMYTAVGIGMGIIIHLLYTFLGVGVLIKESPTLFQIIKYLGGIYIVYLGFMSLFSISKNKMVNATNKKNISKFKALKIGFITNVLNPKVTLFFLSLFTLVLKPNTSYTILILLGVLIVLQTTLWFLLVAYFFTQKSVQENYLKYENLLNKIFGIILIFLAIKILFFS